MQAPVTMTKQSKVDTAREAAFWFHMASTCLYEHAALVEKGVTGHHNLQPSIETARNSMAKAALSFRALDEAEPKNAGLYCAACQRAVDPRDVTFAETHAECERQITNDQPPNTPRPTLEEINAELLAALREARAAFNGALYSVRIHNQIEYAIAMAEGR